MRLRFFWRLKLPRNFDNTIVGKIDTNILDVSFAKHKLLKNNGTERLKSHRYFLFAQMVRDPFFRLIAVCMDDSSDGLIWRRCLRH
jgi:hypothetical protein